MLKETVRQLARQYREDITAIRHHLHAHPELSFQEYETSKYVAQQLQSFGITHIEKVAGTGLVAEIKGSQPDYRTIALRADMDALPITEANDVPYKSKNEGVMHACGHDVHTSSLLGAARILQEVKDNFKGTVRLLFQPGEERIPGGASIMIKEGALEGPRPVNITGQHVMPLIDAGKVGFRSGMYMASADEIYMRVIGKGGHGAIPEMNIDPVLITSHILVALQQVISRFGSPKIPSVLSFGKVQANGATNIIPNEVYVEGTFRTMDEPWRAEAHKRIRSIATSIAEGMGGQVELEIRVGYPFLKNEPELTSRHKANAIAFLGEENVVDLDLWMAAEDFAYYTQHMDACFYRLGVRNEAKGITSSVHTPTFDIDETALETGMGLMAYLALQELNDSK